MKDKFLRLKDITLKMREVAYVELDKDLEFSKLEELDKECHLLSLWNHGYLSQQDFLKGVYSVEVSEMKEEHEIK
jgi:hypothetical protein